ncbi:mau2 chromatid cohesion factor [Dispira parvispora]|uniref:Mau2 chromatid cohesion factor n=1 Tax=Dispira parvispora TaxID=1520584 RepID=A0A9W8E5N9_9FUNG|nr:mau2 chromatid cohesion factor [Dispira parvispora]
MEPLPTPAANLTAVTYDDLWSLCQYYLACARDMSAVQPALDPHGIQHTTESYILAALGISLSVLDKTHANAPPLPSLLELKFRCLTTQLLLLYTENTQEAETHLQKASFLAQKIDSTYAFKFFTRQLQCTLYERTNNLPAAEKMLMGAVQEAFESRFVLHGYHFLERLQQLLAKQGNFRKVFNTIMYGIKISEQLGNTAMRIYLLLLLTHHALVFQSVNQTNKLVNDLKNFFTSNASVGSPPISADKLPRPLHLYYFSLATLNYLKGGEVTLAREMAGRLQQTLDAWQPTSSQEAQGEVFLPLKMKSTDGQLHNRLVDSGEYGGHVLYSDNWSRADHLGVKWLSRSQLYPLVCLLVSLCYQGETSGGPCQRLLNEGLRQVRHALDTMSGHFSPSATWDTFRWYGRLKLHLLYRLVDLSLAQCQYDVAEKVLLEAVSQADSLGEWEAHEQPLVALRWAMLCQKTGQPLQALEFYQACVESDPSPELRVLAQLHQVLIYLSAQYSNPAKAQELLGIIRKACDGTLPPGYQALFGLLDSVNCTELLEAKNRLLDALKLGQELYDTQLQATTLTFLSTIFRVTDSVQTENMLHTSYALSEKDDHTVPMLIAGISLGELYKQGKREDEYQQQTVRNKEIWQRALESLNRPPLSCPDNRKPNGDS